jgi:hypothetical protein
MFRTKEQLLFRYLKQNNLFTNVKLINKIKLNKTNINFINFFDLSLHWKNTNEGFEFWLKHQCEYILFVIKYDKKKLFDKDVVFNYFYKIINQFYFSPETISKTSDYYLSLCEKFKDFSKSL